eukprot:11429546-Karenia_brevis.AAC.1
MSMFESRPTRKSSRGHAGIIWGSSGGCPEVIQESSRGHPEVVQGSTTGHLRHVDICTCLLYTSDAADDM